MIGPSAKPISAKPLCCRPWLKPRRSGRDAAATAVKLVGQYAPSMPPMIARIQTSATRLCTIPEKPDISEKRTMAGISTLRWPIASDKRPEKIANTPHRMPRMPASLPISPSGKPKSAAIAGNSEAMIHRSRPTRPKPTPSKATVFHSYEVSHFVAVVVLCCAMGSRISCGRTPDCSRSARRDYWGFALIRRSPAADDIAATDCRRGTATFVLSW
jgi:hypothetical protein